MALNLGPALIPAGQPINLKRAGIVGRDPVEDTARLNEFVQQQPGRPLYLDHEIEIRSTVDCGPNPLRLTGSHPDRARIYHGAVNSGGLFRVTGTWDPDLPVGATAAKGTNTLNIDTAGIARNDLLQLRDQTSPFYSGYGGEQVGVAGELVRVQAVNSGSQVTVASPLLHDYTTSATVRRMRPVVGNLVQGVSIRHTNPWPAYDGTPVMGASPGGAFRFENTLDDVFRDIEGHGLEKQFVALSGAVGALLDGVRSFDARNDLAGNPYSIKLGQGCWMVRVVNGVARGGRHYITSSSNADEPMPMFVLVADCQVAEHSSGAYDTHSGARWWTFKNCQVYGGALDPSVANSDPAGFQVRSFDQRIIDPVVVGCPTGVAMFGASRPRVHGGLFERVDVGVSVHDSEDVQLRDFEVRDPAVSGVEISSLDSAGGSIDFVPRLDMRRIDVYGNPSVAAFNFDYWDPQWTRVDLGSLYSPDADVSVLGSG